MPTCDHRKVSMRIVREKTARMLGLTADDLEQHKPMFKSLVREWMGEHLSRAEIETGPESTDLIEASQRPGCAAMVSPVTPHAAPQIEVREVSMIHSVAPAIAVLLHGSASTKKSFTCELTTDFMTKSLYAPTCIADQVDCIV